MVRLCLPPAGIMLPQDLCMLHLIIMAYTISKISKKKYLCSMVSFIICTYNRAEYLGISLDALRRSAQGSGCEILVIDNASTDDTASICRERTDIKYYLEERQGLSYARNAGIAVAGGEWLVFLDDDAIVEEEYVQNLLSALEKYPSMDAFGGRIEPRFEAEPPRWLGRWSRSWVSALDMGDKVLPFKGGKYPVGANMGVRRSVVDIVGGFDVDLGRKGSNMSGGEEKDFFLRLAACGYRILYLPSVCVEHIIPQGRTTLEYVERFGCGVGQSERVRCKGVGKLLLRRLQEIYKWCGTLVLWVLYFLGGERVKGDALVLFRRSVSAELF